MKIIDFERKGNVVRFYLGQHTDEWGWVNPEYRDYRGEFPDYIAKDQERYKTYNYYGDDWNDFSFENNAGRVYEEFIYGHCDIKFDFDDMVLDPSSGAFESGYCKDDMVDRKVPCVIVVSRDLYKSECYNNSFSRWISTDGVQKYYFGDEMEPQVLWRGHMDL